MKCFISTAVMILLSLHFPQGAGGTPLRADRPEFTQNPDIVPSGRFQTESGYTFTRKMNENEHKIGELTIRIGLFDNIESIFGINSYKVSETEDKNTSGKDDPSLGLKMKLVSSPNYFLLWNPSVALYAGTLLPTGETKSGTREDTMQPAGKVILAWPLFRVMELGFNMNYTYKSENLERYSQLAEAVSLRLTIGGFMVVFTEFYAYQPEFNDSLKTRYVKGGIAITFLRQSRIDIHAGRGIGNRENDKYVGGGAVYRYQ